MTFAEFITIKAGLDSTAVKWTYASMIIYTVEVWRKG